MTEPLLELLINMAVNTGESTGINCQDKGARVFFSGRTATWLALAALAISVGHVVYAIWRDHINNGEGLLSILG